MKSVSGLLVKKKVVMGKMNPGEFAESMGFGKMNPTRSRFDNLPDANTTPYGSNDTFNISVVCRSQSDFYQRDVIHVSESVVRSFISQCVPNPGLHLSPEWTLCGYADTHDCSNIKKFFDTTAVAETGCDGKSVLPVGLIFGLILGGFLLGLVVMAITCLLCPGISRLRDKISGNKHLISKGHADSRGNNRTSTRSEQYAHIDLDAEAMSLTPQSCPPEGGATSSSMATDQPLYHELSLHEKYRREKEEGGEGTYHVPYNIPGEGPYQPLTRSDNQQSHKYAAINEGVKESAKDTGNKMGKDITEACRGSGEDEKIKRMEDNGVMERSGDGERGNEKKEEEEGEEEGCYEAEHSYFVLEKKS